MQNIFSFIPNYYLQSNKDIEHIIYQLIPLTNHYNPFVSLDSFKKSLEKDIIHTINNNSNIIEGIANLTLMLCDKYLRPNITLPRHRTCIDENFIIDHKTNDFYKNFFENTSYKIELKDLMVFSYFYTQTIHAKHISEHDPDIIKFFADTYSSKSNLNDTDCSPDPRKLVDKIYCFSKANNNNPILPVFFNSNKNDHCSTKFKSYLDIELLLGLVRSSSPRINPFISSKENKNSKININRFIKNLNFITINNNNPYSILKYIKETAISPSILALYNDFFLERITNINFINSLYNLINDFPDLPKSFTKSLDNFVISPLINTRLELLNFVKIRLNNCKTEIERNPEILDDIAAILNNIFLHQIYCSNPITILVFHYLMMQTREYLKKNPSPNISIDSELTSYLEKTCHNKFFLDVDNNNTISTNCPIPSDSTDTKYMHLVRSIYNHFIEKTPGYADHNPIEKLSFIAEKAIPCLLVDQLSSKSVYYTPDNLKDISIYSKLH